MVVGIGRIEVIIPEANSLKAKRKVVKGLIEKTKNKFHISVAEVALNDTWQRCEIGFAVVANDKEFVNSITDKVLDYIDELSDGNTIVKEIEYINY